MLLRDQNSIDPNGWTRGNTKIGFVLEVATSYLPGTCQNSQGLNKLVTDLIDQEYDDNMKLPPKTEGFALKTNIFVLACRLKAKNNREDFTLFVLLQGFSIIWKEHGLILNQELNSINKNSKHSSSTPRSTPRRRWCDRILENEKNIIFGTKLSTLNVGPMMCGREGWQEAEATKFFFNIVLIREDKKFFISVLFQGHSGRTLIDPSFQDNVLIPNSFFEYIYHIGCAVSVHSITNSGLIAGGQNYSKERQTVFFTALNPMIKNHKDPQEVDLSKPRFASSRQTWKRHEDTVYWVGFHFAQRKLKFYQTRSYDIIFYDILQDYWNSKAFVMKSEEVIYQKVDVSRRPAPKISYKDNWMCDLDSDVAGSSKDTQRIEPKPNDQVSVAILGQSISVQVNIVAVSAHVSQVLRRFLVLCINTLLFWLHVSTARCCWCIWHTGSQVTRAGKYHGWEVRCPSFNFLISKQRSRKFLPTRLGCPEWIHMSRKQLGIFGPARDRTEVQYFSKRLCKVETGAASASNLSGSARSRIHSNKLTAPQLLGFMAQDHPVTKETRGADLTFLRTLTMSMREVPSCYGSHANNPTKGIRSGSIISVNNPTCQPTVDLLRFTVKQVPCRSGLYWDQEANVMILLFHTKMMVFFIDSPFCCVKTTIVVRQSRSIDASPDRSRTEESASNLHFCGGVWLTNSNFSALMGMTKVPLSSQHSTLAHRSSALKIEETGLENLCSNLPPLEVDKHLPLLHLICWFLVFLLKCCHGFSLKPVQPMCDGRLFASSLFLPPGESRRPFLRLPFFEVFYTLCYLWLAVLPCMFQHLASGRIL